MARRLQRLLTLSQQPSTRTTVLADPVQTIQFLPPPHLDAPASTHRPFQWRSPNPSSDLVPKHLWTHEELKVLVDEVSTQFHSCTKRRVFRLSDIEWSEVSNQLPFRSASACRLQMHYLLRQALHERREDGSALDSLVAQVRSELEGRSNLDDLKLKHHLCESSDLSAVSDESGDRSQNVDTQSLHGTSSKLNQSSLQGYWKTKAEQEKLFWPRWTRDMDLTLFRLVSAFKEGRGDNVIWPFSNSFLDDWQIPIEERKNRLLVRRQLRGGAIDWASIAMVLLVPVTDCQMRFQYLSQVGLK